MDKDLAIIVGNSAIQTYFAGMADPAEAKFNRGYRLFVKGLREMDADRAIAPDANSTMRLTYGAVAPYKAADAVNYDFITTANGVLEKKDNSNPEFVVPDALDDLIRSRDFRSVRGCVWRIGGMLYPRNGHHGWQLRFARHGCQWRPDRLRF